MPKLPEAAVIIGNGPSGKDVVPLIPQHVLSIALNGAILYDRPFDWWMAFDTGLVLQDWFRKMRLPAGTRTLFGVELYWEMAARQDCIPLADHCFKYWPALAQQFPLRAEKRWHGSPIMDGVLRGQCTIAGCAVQFAYWAGVRNLYLCGVDMRGTGKANGGTNPKHEGKWDVSNRLSYLCNWLAANKGMQVRSLSETALSIPVVDVADLRL